jgi:hypothetical protein
LSKEKSTLHPRFREFKDNRGHEVGIGSLGDGLSLNRWYHIAYTISDPEKRMDIYIDGEWEGYFCIQNVKKEKVIFNDGPLHIGRSFNWRGFNGEIRYNLKIVITKNTI